MALDAGIRLGPYEIVSPLGNGGMGEVYKARDTRLERTVAIKVLNPTLVVSPDLRARFEREAKTISQLNHPNICCLYDVGHEDGTDFLVMEFLEGESLGDRLKRGPLPLKELIAIGCDIADALDRAHRAGVVHRDLKPANVMLTKSGAKLLDFGLAKPAAMGASAGSGSAPLLSAAMTMTSPSPQQSPLTQQGALVGTVQYMSPEQIQGLEADARSDIFAFGAVLYEMATGKRPFEGKSQIKVASAILEDEPVAVTSVAPAAPDELEYVIRICLAKDPNERFQCAHDLRIQLRRIGECISAGAHKAPLENSSPTAQSWRRRIVLFSSWAVALAAILLLWWFRPAAQSPRLAARFTIPLAAHTNLAADNTLSLAISRDGSELGYVSAESGIGSLFVRRLNSFDAVPILGSEGATFPFFSPDGQWIAFFSQGKLLKAPTAGGSAVPICDITTINGGVWLSDDTIIVSGPSGALLRIPSGGGDSRPALANNKAAPYLALPFVINGTDWIGGSDFGSEAGDIGAVNLKTGDFKVVVKNARSATFDDGQLIYYASGALWAQPLDLRAMTVSGALVEVVAAVDESNFVPQFAVSNSGVLLYASGAPGNSSRNLFLVDRSGQEKKIDVPAGDYVDPAMSPDGKRFSIALRRVGEQSLGVYDIERGVMMRLPAAGRRFAAPVWTPDSRYLIFDAPDPSGKPALFRVAADGSTPAEMLLSLPANGHVTSISPQGEAAVMMNDPKTSVDLWLFSLADRKLEVFRRTPAMEKQGTFSPDGKWLAYCANDTGRDEIYVAPVHGSGRWQISTDGGEQPRWSKTGKEIFYRIGTKMMSVAVDVHSGFQASRPTELFDSAYDRGGAVAGYDVSPDGKSFVMIKSERSNPTEIRVMTNWLNQAKQGTSSKPESGS